MTPEEKRVAELIRDAFRGVTLGSGVGLFEGQGLDDYASDKDLRRLREQDELDDWTRVPHERIDSCSSSLSFFDAEGMRFHLPAILMAELQGALTTADPLFHLTYAKLGAQDRFALLSAEQRVAVREYLRLVLGDPCHGFNHDSIAAAMKGYWSESNDPR